ncbi:hypothetical protein KBX35_12140 [Micromonospora sp. C32]|uniref:hypothetical protein n=1 Tax=Micromonospora sp. C32 TaxID=2824877 RepID=UPI001B360E96|nr:hypothetical protein [Micromonospora sp. C32]MBQ1055534.1 hypothetical protein [Micromonospora sp. C32]
MKPAESTAPDGARVALAWLGQPVTVLSLIVLVLNDHVLKAAFPGLVTGKLSDVAGLVLAPPLVAVLVTLFVPRLRPRVVVGFALGSVGAGFVLVKSSGYAATAASGLWSAVSGPSLIRADRTDLLTLPALALAAWTWRRARRDAVGRRAARLVRLVVLLPAATVAVAATSAATYPDAIGATVVDGRLAAGVAFEAYPDDETRPWYTATSDDAGVTWRDPTPAEEEALRGRSRTTTGPEREQCSTASPQRCYRLSPGRIRVQESDDAGRTWRLSWEITERQRELLKARHQEAGPDGARITGQDLAVLDLPGGGHVVLVANGRDGFALRDADGGWRRIGFPDGWPSSGPPPLDRIAPGDRHYDPLWAFLLVVNLAALVLVVSAVRAARSSRAGRALPVQQGAIQVLAALVLLSLWRATFLLLPIPLMCWVTLQAGSLALAFWPRRSWRLPGRWFAEVLTAAALTATLAGAVMVGWLYGRPVYITTAVALAGLATVPGLLLGWRAARLVEPWRPPYPPAVDVFPRWRGPAG